MRLSIPNSILLGLSLVAISIFASAYLYTDSRREIGRFSSVVEGNRFLAFDTIKGCWFAVNYRIAITEVLCIDQFPLTKSSSEP